MKIHQDSHQDDDSVNGLSDLNQKLQQLYGEDFEIWRGSHHARFLPSDVPFHIISRVFQGRHLLRPCKILNRIIGGVLGRALETYPHVRLFAVAVLSNHCHFMLQGPTTQVVCFIAFVKREISRRWGQEPAIHWPGSMWHNYIATALPTPESQIQCLKYILGQGVKEGLVAKPQLWPGVHCARPLLSGTQLRGEWLDATAWAVARDRERRKQHPEPVRKLDFYLSYKVKLTPIEPWKDLTPDEYRARIRELCEQIEQEGQQARAGKPPLGTKAIAQIPMHRRSELPHQPWISGRRRLICWSDPRASETKAYIERYWGFQEAFRLASRAVRKGLGSVVFPIEAFRPWLWPTGESAMSPVAA